MMRRIWLALLLTLFASPALADKRVALVIGNAAYQHSPKLANTLNDARGMRDVLQKLGFTVVYGEDLNQRDLNRKIRDFSEAVEGADVAITYFAGHGSTFGGIPYVVPVDAEFASLAEVTYQLVPVETYIAQLRQVRGIRIAILDACRDNEAEKALKRTASRSLGGQSNGLAGINASGLIVAYSTQVQATASDGDSGHSPFTAAILHNIATPGLDVTELFRAVGREVTTKTKGEQTPEISLSLFEKYYLVGQDKIAALSAPSRAQLLDPKQAADECRRRVPSLEELGAGRGSSGTDAVIPCETAVAAAPDDKDLAAKLAAAYMVARQPDKAHGLALKGANGGATDAMLILAYLKLQDLGNPDLDKKAVAQEAFDWAKRASDNGNDLGTGVVAMLYFYGVAVAKDEQTGLRLITKAAEAGNRQAMMTLATDRIFLNSYLVKDPQTRMFWLNRAVDARYPPAINYLATLLESGDDPTGTVKDATRAVALYRQAADLGNVAAMKNLGQAYETGTGVRKSALESDDWYRRAIVNGGPFTAYNIGFGFQFGADGFSQDAARAVEFYQKAADGGELAGIVALANIYADTTSAFHDDNKSNALFRQSAEAGDPRSMIALGFRTMKGIGTSQDKNAASSWFFKAAEKGGLATMRKIAALYRSGGYFDYTNDMPTLDFKGFPADKVRASEWYLRIVEMSRNAQDRYDLAEIYADDDATVHNDVEADAWYLKAADLGDIDAMLKIGARLADGSSSNERATRLWFQRAADSGGADTMYKVGELYRDGSASTSGSSISGFPPDKAQAVIWFKKAAAGGNKEAAKALEELGQAR